MELKYIAISVMQFLANVEVVKEAKKFGVFIITSTENDNSISLSHKFYRVNIKM